VGISDSAELVAARARAEEELARLVGTVDQVADRLGVMSADVRQVGVDVARGERSAPRAAGEVLRVLFHGSADLGAEHLATRAAAFEDATADVLRIERSRLTEYAARGLT
jgi:hypothetical protein